MSNLDMKNFMSDHYKVEDFTHLNWSGTFQDYIDKISENPKIARNAFQRIYDMIMSYGTSQYKEYKKDITRYHFFDDPDNNGKDAVFGIDVHLMKLVNFFKAAALGYGTEKRVLLLHGPVGSAKSSIARNLKIEETQNYIFRNGYTPLQLICMFLDIQRSLYGKHTNDLQSMQKWILCFNVDL